MYPTESVKRLADKLAKDPQNPDALKRASVLLVSLVDTVAAQAEKIDDLERDVKKLKKRAKLGI